MPRCSAFDWASSTAWSRSRSFCELATSHGDAYLRRLPLESRRGRSKSARSSSFLAVRKGTRSHLSGSTSQPNSNSEGVNFRDSPSGKSLRASASSGASAGSRPLGRAPSSPNSGSSRPQIIWTIDRAYVSSGFTRPRWSTGMCSQAFQSSGCSAGATSPAASPRRTAMTNALANMEKPRDVDRETRKLFRTISVSVEGSLVPQGARSRFDRPYGFPSPEEVGAHIEHDDHPADDQRKPTYFTPRPGS